MNVSVLTISENATTLGESISGFMGKASERPSSERMALKSGNILKK